MKLKPAIEQGRPDELEKRLQDNPALANTKVRWGGVLNRIETDPLHYISDCVFNGLLTNGTEVALANTLINYGAQINGSEGAETPLIGAASLSVASVAKYLINNGADVHATSIHGATALHWVCYVGLPDVASLLLQEGAKIESRCIDFQSTPLFWCVHAIRYGGKTDHSSIVTTARVLVEHGADVKTANFQNYPVQQLALDTGNKALIKLLNAAR